MKFKDAFFKHVQLPRPKNFGPFQVAAHEVVAYGVSSVFIVGFLFTLAEDTRLLGPVEAVFNFYFDVLRRDVGLVEWLSKVSASSLTALTFVAVLWVPAGIVKSEKGKDGRIVQKVRPSRLIFAILLCHFVAVVLFGAGKNTFVDRTTGEDLKFYVRLADRCEYSDQADLHPTYRIPFRPITRVMAEECLACEKGSCPRRFVEVGNYFDTATRDPIVYYDLDSLDGGVTIKLYPYPGYDPYDQSVFREITPEVARQLPRSEDRLQDFPFVQVLNNFPWDPEPQKNGHSLQPPSENFEAISSVLGSRSESELKRNLTTLANSGKVVWGDQNSFDCPSSNFLALLDEGGNVAAIFSPALRRRLDSNGAEDFDTLVQNGHYRGVFIKTF